MRRSLLTGAALVGTLLATTSLGTAGRRDDEARAASAPRLPPASQFSARVRNPWFPLVPGTSYRFQGIKDGQPSHEVLTVTRATKTIAGVPCVVISDRLWVRGKLRERTTDWYTQDAAGNVWYFGEDTAELDAGGKVVSTEGTWRAGVDGARPGIFMPAHPRPGQSFAQEYYKGHAEDRFRVIGVFSTTTGGTSAGRAAHARVDPARARRARSQDLRAGHRHAARADDQGRRRAQRARGDQHGAMSTTTLSRPCHRGSPSSRSRLSTHERNQP